MADRLTQTQRHLNMSHIHSKDTKPEVKVRKALFKLGFRFRKNVKSLPGTPDIVLPKYKAVIFINGCFWHMHPGCKKATIPATRHDWWEKKLLKNVVNDKLNRDKLEEMGWLVIVIWQCEIERDFTTVIARLNDILLNRLANMEAVHHHD